MSTDFVAFAHIRFDEAGAIAGSEGVVQQGQSQDGSHGDRGVIKKLKTDTIGFCRNRII